MLSTDNLAGYHRKLASRYIGPFRVAQAGQGTVTLELPDDLRVHQRVNVEHVKRYVPSVGEWPGRVQHSRPLPVRVSDDGRGEWEVVAILGKGESLEEVAAPPAVAGEEKAEPPKKVNKEWVTRYLVQWAGYDMSECSWERAANLDGARELVDDYERRLALEAPKGRQGRKGGKRAAVMLLTVEEAVGS